MGSNEGEISNQSRQKDSTVDQLETHLRDRRGSEPTIRPDDETVPRNAEHNRGNEEYERNRPRTQDKYDSTTSGRNNTDESNLRLDEEQLNKIISHSINLEEKSVDIMAFFDNNFKTQDRIDFLKQNLVSEESTIFSKGIEMGFKTNESGLNLFVGKSEMNLSFSELAGFVGNKLIPSLNENLAKVKSIEITELFPSVEETIETIYQEYVKENPNTSLDKKSKIIADERTVMFSELGEPHRKILEFTNIDDHEINVHTNDKGKEFAIFYEDHERRTQILNALEIDKETDNFKLLGFIDNPNYINMGIGEEIVSIFDEELPANAVDEIYAKANDMFDSIQEEKQEIEQDEKATSKPIKPKKTKEKIEDNQVNLFDIKYDSKLETKEESKPKKEQEEIKKVKEIIVDLDTTKPTELDDVDDALRTYLEVQKSLDSYNFYELENINIINFQIKDEDIDINKGFAPKERFDNNVKAIETLKNIEKEGRFATKEEQFILNKYVGWGGLSDVFDKSKTYWGKENQKLSEVLSPSEYKAARESTLTAFYTPPIVVNSMYKALEDMGLPKDISILDSSMGIGNFMGKAEETFEKCQLNGTELDSITGRIATQLYQKANIEVSGFEKTKHKDNSFDVSIGNVPFGDFKVNDKKYDKENFQIHDYFFAKNLDKVRDGGIIALITTKGTLDKENPKIMEYIAQRADLLGAIRLPNNAFKSNANTEVTSDIIFLQKRDKPPEIMPSWVDLAKDENGIKMNNYFVENPNMIMGEMKIVSSQFGMTSSCIPNKEIDLKEQLEVAIKNIKQPNKELLEKEVENKTKDKESPNLKRLNAPDFLTNHSYMVIKDTVYYKKDNEMIEADLNKTAIERVKDLIPVREKLQDILNLQVDRCSDDELSKAQKDLNVLYDNFNKKHGLINSSGNKNAFKKDTSYPLLCSLEVMDNDKKNMLNKADIFFKRTIKNEPLITQTSSSVEALGVSIGRTGKVDLEFMQKLMGENTSIDRIIEDLNGVIFKNPLSDLSNNLDGWENADEYLSGNVREKLEIAEQMSENYPNFAINVEKLKEVQPTPLKASEIEVSIGANWIDLEYYKQFMFETLGTKQENQGNRIDLKYSDATSGWSISGKNIETSIKIDSVYGTKRANAYKILENTLNKRDTKVYDDVLDPQTGENKKQFNSKATAEVSQKQEILEDTFNDWIFKDPARRNKLVDKYNEIFNSSRPREFNGNHLEFRDMTNTINLNEHQKNAVARTLYGGNTMLAHCVGAGKSFTMIASAIEGKKIGLHNKSMIVVPNHLTEQLGQDVTKLYPAAKCLIASKKDFTPNERKEFCSKIATGDYDVVVIGHSQFEKIPLSEEKQKEYLDEQLDDILNALTQAKEEKAEQYTIKQLEKLEKKIRTNLDKLGDDSHKDKVVTFEELGVDKLYVDESHKFKNLFTHSKMSNVSGVSQTSARKATDMFTKCRYMDEITQNKGVVFATGTPISNSITELFTMMRYLQFDTLNDMGLKHFDNWANTFAKKTTSIEITPIGDSFRAKTRLAKFFNIPELVKIWKEVTDIQTADMLNLPTPIVKDEVIVTKPTEYQQEALAEFSKRSDRVKNRTVSPKEDNFLKITSDGRKLALDQRLINPLYPDDPNSKLNACVNKVFEVFERTKEDKSTQLIFCDMSTPKSKKTQENKVQNKEEMDEIFDDGMNDFEIDGLEQAENSFVKENNFNVYDDIKEKLIDKGVKPEEIAFIHDADTDVKKDKLFSKVRSGEVRVLLGSTEKMGAGSNVQDKLVALHHLDVPWRPA